MVNYLVRLGWSYGDEEIFSLEDLVQKFAIENVGRSAGVFNTEKLLWLNAHYIKTGDPVRLAGLLTPFLEERGVNPTTGPDLVAVIGTLQERAKTMLELADGAVFYYKADFGYDEKGAAKFFSADTPALLEELIGKLDEAGKTFHVLLLKTNLCLPYTSVFLQLDCAYWNADAEKRLRAAKP